VSIEYLIFREMINFQSYPFLHFPFCGGQINIDFNPELKGVAIPNFVDADLNLRVSNNPSLEVITLPELYDLGGHNIIEGNGQLQSGLRWDEIWSFHDDPKLWFA